MSRSPISRHIPVVLLLALSAAIFLGGLGRLPLMGRDESLYAEAAREMAAGGDWITPRVNGGPFLEKPPLNYWAAGAAIKLLGPSPLAVRLPAALSGVLVVLLVSVLGARVWGWRAGLLGGVALCTCLQMAVIARMGIMDVPLTLLVTAAMLAYAAWWFSGSLAAAVGFGLAVALGILLKGGAGLLPVFIAVVDLAVRRLRRERPPRAALSRWLSALLAALLAAAVAAPWFLVMSARQGPEFGGTLLVHEHLRRVLQPMQGHGGPFWIYLPVIGLGFFPWAAFLTGNLWRGLRAAARRRAPAEDGPAESEGQRFWRGLAAVWFWTVLILFSLVSTKLPGYVTPLYPALALLAGVELDRRLSSPGRAAWVGIIVSALLLAALVSLLPRAAEAAVSRHDVGLAPGRAAALLFPGAIMWAMGCLLIALGAFSGLARAPGAGLGLLTVGQVVVIWAVLTGLLPVVADHLEGGREYRLARQARVMEKAMGRQVSGLTLLYDTRPEAAAFALGRPVPVFEREQQADLLRAIRARSRERGGVMVIAPVESMPVFAPFHPKELARAGDRVLLHIGAKAGTKETSP